jgi:type IV pilus assembly protein PilV
MLFEVMVSLLIFSVGILGIIGMMASAVQNESDAQNRTIACFLVDDLIGRMWTDHLQGAAAFQTKYAGGGGTDGAGYTAWFNGIIDADNPKLPGVTATTNVPVVAVTTEAGFAPADAPTSVVDITLSWQPPSRTGAPHQYRVITRIK